MDRNVFGSRAPPWPWKRSDIWNSLRNSEYAIVLPALQTSLKWLKVCSESPYITMKAWNSRGIIVRVRCKQLSPAAATTARDCRQRSLSSHLVASSSYNFSTHPPSPPQTSSQRPPNTAALFFTHARASDYENLINMSCEFVFQRWSDYCNEDGTRMGNVDDRDVLFDDSFAVVTITRHHAASGCCIHRR